MAVKLLLLVLVGVFAYFLEYVEFPLHDVIRLVVIFVGAGLVFAAILWSLPSRVSGRLAAVKDPGSGKREKWRPVNWVVFVAAVYVIAYMQVVNPSDRNVSESVLDRLEDLTPTEWFWLVAPVVLLHWYRQFRSARGAGNV